MSETSETGVRPRRRRSRILLGASLLVAPVVTSGASSRSLYLPAGASWIGEYGGDDV